MHIKHACRSMVYLAYTDMRVQRALVQIIKFRVYRDDPTRRGNERNSARFCMVLRSQIEGSGVCVSAPLGGHVARPHLALLFAQ